MEAVFTTACRRGTRTSGGLRRGYPPCGAASRSCTEQRALQSGKIGNAKVDGVATHDVVNVHDGLAAGLGQVEDAANVVLLEDLAKGALVLLGELDHLDVDLVLDARLKELLDLVVGGVQLVTHGGEVVDNGGEPLLVQLAAEEETFAGLRHAEVHGRLQRGPVGLNKVLAKAGNLTCGGHLDAEEGVGAGETGPGELGHLGSEVVTLDGHEVDRLRDLLANESLGGNVDEVGAEDLAHEGERTGGTKVALDDLQRRLTALRVVGLDDLHVEGTGDTPGLRNPLSDILDTVHGGLVEVRRGQDKSGVTGVDTSLLDVLTNSMEDQVAVRSNTVNIDLLGTLNELADDDRVVGRHVGGGLKLLLQVLLTVNDSHGSTGKDVTGANKNGVSDLISKGLSLLDGGELLPCRLVDANAIEDLGELLSVLGLVNVLRVGSENLSTAGLLETKRNVLGKLATDGDHDSGSALELVNIHNTLITQLLEIKLISSVEIGAGLGGTNSTPIKLNGATNAVNTTAKDDSALVLECNVVGRGVVGGVQVVGVGGELGREGIDFLDPGADAKGKTSGAHLVFGASNSQSNLAVREAELLSLQDLVLLKVLQTTSGLEAVLAVNKVLQLVQEPLVNLGQLMNPVHRVVLVEHGLANGEPAAVGGVLELVVQVLELVALEANELGIDLANSLLERLFKGASNSHDLTDRLHGTADVTLDVLELGQIPAGNLGDDIVKGRLEVCSRGLGDGIGELRKTVTQADLGGGVRERVSGSLGGQSRRTRKTGVDLNDTVVEAVGLERILNIALSHDTKMTNDLNGGGSQHVVLLITQGLTGSNDDTVSGVNAQGIEVLHVANSNAVVVRVTDDLILNLLPALQRLLDQDLGRQSQGAGSHVAKLLLVVCETGTQTTERVGGTDDNGISDLLGGIKSLLNGSNSDRLGNRDVDLVEGASEEVAILTGLKSLDAGSQNLDAVLLEETHALHLNTEVQGGLTTKREEDTIGLLLLDNVVDLVGERVVGLDGGNVRVNEDGLDTGLLQSLQSLRSFMHLLNVDADRRLDHAALKIGLGVRRRLRGTGTKRARGEKALLEQLRAAVLELSPGQAIGGGEGEVAAGQSCRDSSTMSEDGRSSTCQRT
ncbi:hypothetical protein ColTof4_08108 [Colletotrichum tofieldiae]|nr:hypothetical protein ColTof4_08108 [Colletotrichum tofieldiae]